MSAFDELRSRASHTPDTPPRRGAIDRFDLTAAELTALLARNESQIAANQRRIAQMEALLAQVEQQVRRRRWIRGLAILGLVSALLLWGLAR